MEETWTYRPVVRLVRLHGDGGALALREVVRVVDVLEAARPDDGVDVRPDLQPPRQNHIAIRKQVPRASAGCKWKRGRTPPELTIESRRVVMMGRLPPKIQCSALAAATSAATDKSFANIVNEWSR